MKIPATRHAVKSHNGSPAANSGASVRSVERALELLFRLAAHGDGAGLQQLASEVGCSKSTVHRLLATLQRVEVVEREPVSRRYRLGRRVEELAPASSGQAALRRAALPAMAQLRDEIGETVTLHLALSDSHVVVEQCESRHEIRRILPIGQAVPLLSGATAKAMLAAIPPRRAEEMLSHASGAEPIPSLDELASIRSQGFSLSPGERISGGTAVSAPILGPDGSLLAALSVSGPTFRFTLSRARAAGPALAAAAARISATLGYHG